MLRKITCPSCNKLVVTLDIAEASSLDKSTATTDKPQTAIPFKLKDQYGWDTIEGWGVKNILKDPNCVLPCKLLMTKLPKNLKERGDQGQRLNIFIDTVFGAKKVRIAGPKNSEEFGFLGLTLAKTEYE